MDRMILRAMNEAIEDIPLTSKPYQNRYGHWVWRSIEVKGENDMSWPGIRPPEGAKPVIKDRKWQWEISL